MNLLREIREYNRFLRTARKTLWSNLKFRQAHPDVRVPPLYALYDAQSHTSYAKYYESGAQAAKYYWEMFQEYVANGSQSLSDSHRVLEWGCGPARIIRHFPRLAAAAGANVQLAGTDYNATSINWAKANLPGIDFRLNQLAPPLPFGDDSFDFIYCRSVFTHLSYDMHMAWMKELLRLLRPDGVLSLSTQGMAHRQRLTAAEAALYDRGQLVVRAASEEGKLNFSAFHPPDWVRDTLLAGLEVLRHDAPPETQEVWVVRRPGARAASV